MEANKGNIVLRSVLVGLGMMVLYFVVGLALDYVVTQLLSQFVIADCSEDCYFSYFNLFFCVVVILSILGGILSGWRLYKRSSENK